METIKDYKPNTAYIKLPRCVFKDQEYYNNLLEFLMLPDDTAVIEVEVNNACINLDYYKVVRINTKIMNKEELQNLCIKMKEDCKKTNYRGY